MYPSPCSKDRPFTTLCHAKGCWMNHKKKSKIPLNTQKHFRYRRSPRHRVVFCRQPSGGECSKHEHESPHHARKHHGQAICTAKAQGKTLNIRSSSTGRLASKHGPSGCGISSLGCTSTCRCGGHRADGACIDSHRILGAAWVGCATSTLTGRVT